MKPRPGKHLVDDGLKRARKANSGAIDPPRTSILDALYIGECCLEKLEMEAMAETGGYPIIGLLTGDKSHHLRKVMLALDIHRLVLCQKELLEQRRIIPAVTNWGESLQRIKASGQSVLGYYYLDETIDDSDTPSLFAVDHQGIVELLKDEVEGNQPNSPIVVQLARVRRSIHGKDLIEAGVRLDFFQRISGTQIIPISFRVLNLAYVHPDFLKVPSIINFDIYHRITRLKQLIAHRSDSIFTTWQKNHQGSGKDQSHYHNLLTQMVLRELNFAWSDTQKQYPILEHLPFHEAPHLKMKGFTATVNKQLASELEPLLIPLKRPRVALDPASTSSSTHSSTMPIRNRALSVTTSSSSSSSSKTNSSHGKPVNPNTSPLINGSNYSTTCITMAQPKPIPRPILPAGIMIPPRSRTPSNDSISSGSASPNVPSIVTTTNPIVPVTSLMAMTETFPRPSEAESLPISRAIDHCSLLKSSLDTPNLESMPQHELTKTTCTSPVISSSERGDSSIT